MHTALFFFAYYVHLPLYDEKNSLTPSLQRNIKNKERENRENIIKNFFSLHSS